MTFDDEKAKVKSDKVSELSVIVVFIKTPYLK